MDSESPLSFQVSERIYRETPPMFGPGYVPGGSGSTEAAEVDLGSFVVEQRCNEVVGVREWEAFREGNR